MTSRRKQHKTSKKHGRSMQHSSRFACEALEKRVLLSLVVPALNSHPGAFQSLYLDFVGSAPFGWSNSSGNYEVRGPNSSVFAPTPVQAFSTDSDYNNFS